MRVDDIQLGGVLVIYWGIRCVQIGNPLCTNFEGGGVGGMALTHSHSLAREQKRM